MKIALKITVPCLVLLAALPAFAQTSEPAANELTPLLTETLPMARAGDAAGAIARLEAAREADRIVDPELALLGALYVESGLPGKALDVLAPLAQREDIDPLVLFNAGRAALELDRVEEADSYLQRAVRSETATPAIRLLGLLRMRQGRIEEAYGFLVAWASMDLSDLEVRTAAIFCALELSRVEEAEALIDGLPPTDPRVGYLRGRLRASQGRHEVAVGELQPFVDFILAPPEGEGEKMERDSGLIYDILAEYGRAMLAVGRGSESVAALEKATAVRPEKKDAWQLLGQALLGAGRTEEARKALSKYQQLAEQEVASARDATPPPSQD